MFSEQFIFALVRQGLLFLHLLLFAYAIIQVLSADIGMIRSGRLDADAVKTLEKRVSAVLLGLWLTGFGLVAFEFKGDVTALLGEPKLATKLAVVSVLTLNGFALHYVAFPRMCAPKANSRRCAVICSVLGSISTVSWIYAAFLGSARRLVPFMTLEMFAALYLVLVAAGIVTAVIFVRPRVARMMRERWNALAAQMDSGEDPPANPGLVR